jgi:hypothetical protein
VYVTQLNQYLQYQLPTNKTMSVAATLAPYALAISFGTLK